jgi:hypothetical protein
MMGVDGLRGRRRVAAGQAALLAPAAVAHAQGVLANIVARAGRLTALTPFLSSLAGPNAATELREVAQAVIDVGRWWP